MEEQFERTKLILGDDAVRKLRSSHIALFGVGGVGGYTAEALARAGIGEIDITDADTVSESNINRQIIALHSTVGRLKVDVARERILDICPDIKVKTNAVFFLPENADTFDFSEYDYVIDAIDTVSGKIAIIEKAKAVGVPVISCMGAGNKTDPTAFRVCDISKTSVCPLARAVRHELKKRNIKDVKVVYSEETPIQNGGKAPGSLPFVPPVAGLIMAGEVIKDITCDFFMGKTF